MKKCYELSASFSTPEKRNLLSVAYKNVVGARRNAWRILSSLESKFNEDEKKREIAADYRRVIEEELESICREVIVSSSNVCMLIG